MNSRRPINKLACSGLVLLLVLGFYASRGAAGQVVSGVYKVTQTTDLGNEVRVTMQIRLMNASEDRIFVTQARVREFLPHGKAKDEPVGVILGPHDSAEFTHEFIIAKKEYELWSRGERPRLSLRLQVAGAEESTMTIALMQLPGSK